MIFPSEIHYPFPHPFKYYWQSAYCDAPCYPYIIYGDIWDQLSSYSRKDSSYLRKYYNSYDEAIKDLHNVLKFGRVKCEICHTNQSNGTITSLKNKCEWQDKVQYICNECYKKIFNK